MEEAKKIIARLIDLKYITGDEALILFEAMHTPKEIEKVIEKAPYWWYQPISIPTTWKEKEPDYTITCSNNDYLTIGNTKK